MSLGSKDTLGAVDGQYSCVGFDDSDGNKLGLIDGTLLGLIDGAEEGLSDGT